VETEVKTFSDDLQSVHCANLWLRWWTDHNPHFAPSITQEHPPERLSRISAFKLLADDGR